MRCNHLGFLRIDRPRSSGCEECLSGLQMNGPFLIDCPIDYRENEKLNQALGEVICRG